LPIPFGRARFLGDGLVPWTGPSARGFRGDYEELFVPLIDVDRKLWYARIADSDPGLPARRPTVQFTRSDLDVALLAVDAAIIERKTWLAVQTLSFELRAYQLQDGGQLLELPQYRMPNVLSDVNGAVGIRLAKDVEYEAALERGYDHTSKIEVPIFVYARRHDDLGIDFDILVRRGTAPPLVQAAGAIRNFASRSALVELPRGRQVSVLPAAVRPDLVVVLQTPDGIGLHTVILPSQSRLEHFPVGPINGVGDAYLEDLDHGDLIAVYTEVGTDLQRSEFRLEANLDYRHVSTRKVAVLDAAAVFSLNDRIARRRGPPETLVFFKPRLVATDRSPRAVAPQLAFRKALVPRPCVDGRGAHCLNQGRFEVSVDWRTPQGDRGFGRRVDLTDDSGLFYFFEPSNLELIAKVLDACATPFQSYWVFSAGLTDVEYVMEVFDSETGRRRHYVNPLKTAALPVQDTSAFKACALGAGSPLAGESEESWALPGWARDALRARRGDPREGAAAGGTAAGRTAAAAARSPRAGDCTPGPTTLCLGGGRFEVEAEWVTKSGNSGEGQSIELTDDTGAFWFFNAANVEILVKVLDACASAFESFWVFAAGLTNVEVRLTVTDTQTGMVKVYDNPLDRPFQPIQDTRSFATCP
jgi:hypothetical protein